MVEGDWLPACAVGQEAETVAVGFSFDTGGFWTRNGYDNAMEDCDKLVAAVVAMRVLLSERLRDIKELRRKADPSEDPEDTFSTEEATT